ncbi:PIN domain-containing protein [Microbacterium sp. Mu-80]|uniref:PIN domain-containing protein n=1 Tax=Microbacterium bandirmense TaxID=3122050 RepID=A0ABU8LBY0_9MICO
MEPLVDTNVIINAARNGDYRDLYGGFVSSVTLHELFGVYAGGNWKYRYYPKSLSASYRAATPRTMNIGFDRRHLEHRGGTDSLVFSGGGGFAARQLFAHASTAHLVENFGAEALAQQASQVSSRRKSSFQRAARAIDECGLQPLPLTQSAVDDAVDIFETFNARYAGKKDHRNTMNDLLILAHARHRGLVPMTNDDLMTVLAVDVLDWTLGSPDEPTSTEKRREVTGDRQLHTVWRSRR